MVNERIIIFGVISDGLIAGQLSAVQSEATRGGTHDVESRAFGLFFYHFPWLTLKITYAEDCLNEGTLWEKMDCLSVRPCDEFKSAIGGKKVNERPLVCV